MADLAETVVAFILSDDGRAHRDADSILAACVDRWPNLTQAEFDSGFGAALAAMRAKATKLKVPRGAKSAR